MEGSERLKLTVTYICEVVEERLLPDEFVCWCLTRIFVLLGPGSPRSAEVLPREVTPTSPDPAAFPHFPPTAHRLPSL